MKLFWEYIKWHKKVVLVYIIFVVIFSFIFELYQLPLSAVAYAAGICSFIGMIVILLDYKKICKKHEKLEDMILEIQVTTENLPTACGILEADYQAVIDSLFTSKKLLSNEMSLRHTDLTGFYTAWVHQIKIPISSMKWVLQESRTRQGRGLYEELQRIEQYVEMVLYYLQLDSDTAEYVIKEYDLDEIVKIAVRRFAPQCFRRRLMLEYEPLNCKVLTDEKWLLFVIEQVLSNALKYTESGGIFITMEADSVLCIRDTGVGIVPEELPYIFERGYTGNIGHSSEETSRIGLYLCHRICGNLRHRIYAVSDINEGTIIKIDLSHGIVRE